MPACSHRQFGEFRELFEQVVEELLIRASFSVNFCPLQRSLAFTSCEDFLKLPARSSADWLDDSYFVQLLNHEELQLCISCFRVAGQHNNSSLLNAASAPSAAREEAGRVKAS